jgi:hypothetical protein
MRFFDLHWRTHDINWYLAQFAADDDQMVGDVSPPYAFLPTFAIRLIRELNPRLKLIVLMREPVARTWSQVRHAFIYGEPPFVGAQGTFEDISREQLVEAFLDDQAASGNDYKSILSRWLQYFDKSQFHVEYIEHAERDPERYVQDIFGFLGIAGGASATTKYARERHNVGVKRALPAWAVEFLNDLYGPVRTAAESYVAATFGRSSPWPRTSCHRSGDMRGALHAADGRPLAELAGPEDTAPKRRDLSAADQRLLRVLGGLIMSWEADKRGGPRCVSSVQGYNIFQWHGMVFGLPRKVDLPTRISEASPTTPSELFRLLLRFWPSGLVLGNTVLDVEEQLSSRRSTAVMRVAKVAVVEALRATRAYGFARAHGLFR